MKRGVRTGVVITTAVIVSLVAGYFIRDHLARTTYGPQGRVESYLAALVEGRATDAIALLDPDVTSAERVLLTDEIYRAADIRPTGYEILDVRIGEKTATVDASLTMDAAAPVDPRQRRRHRVVRQRLPGQPHERRCLRRARRRARQLYLRCARGHGLPQLRLAADGRRRARRGSRRGGVLPVLDAGRQHRCHRPGQRAHHHVHDVHPAGCETVLAMSDPGYAVTAIERRWLREPAISFDDRVVLIDGGEMKIDYK